MPMNCPENLKIALIKIPFKNVVFKWVLKLQKLSMLPRLI